VTTFSLEFLLYWLCHELPLKAIVTAVTEQDSKAVREVNLFITLLSTTNSFMKWEDVVLEL
jgi:hypothetical protein